MALGKNPTQLEVVQSIKDVEGNTVYNAGTLSTVAGNANSSSYKSVRWYNSGIDGITAPYDGMKIMVKIPLAGVGTAGVILSINGDSADDYHPVAYNVSTVLTTHFPVNSYKLFTYDATAKMTCYKTAGTSTTVTGVWKGEANYDSNNYASVRQYQHGANAAGTSPKYPVLTRYNLTNKNGSYDTAYTRFRTDVTIDTSNGNLDAPTMSENGIALSSRYLPNFILNISHQSAGNPRQVKFLTVNYATAATYFKMSATSCHDNGTSYQFLEDIIIGCTTSGTVVCNVYKYCQQTVTLDNVTRNYGDVFYVIDTTNKIVDFYILCGQWASSQFTRATKIGNTTIAYITQHTGTATYYSSGTKVWADGDSALYVRTGDLKTVNGNSLIGSGDITITAPAPTNMVTTDTDQTISGTKTFTSSIYSNADIHIGDSAGNSKAIYFDKNGTNSGSITFYAPAPALVNNMDTHYFRDSSSSSSHSIYIDAKNGYLMPETNNGVQLGSSNNKWGSGYFGGEVYTTNVFTAYKSALGYGGYRIKNNDYQIGSTTSNTTSSGVTSGIGTYQFIDKNNEWLGICETTIFQPANTSDIPRVQTWIGARQWSGTTSSSATKYDSRLKCIATKNDRWNCSMGDFVPDGNNTYNLGRSGNVWKNIYGTTIYEGGTALSSKYQAKLSSYVSSVNGQTGAVTVPSMPFTLTYVGTCTSMINSQMLFKNAYDTYGANAQILFMPYSNNENIMYCQNESGTSITGYISYPFITRIAKNNSNLYYLRFFDWTSAQKVAYRMANYVAYKITF